MSVPTSTPSGRLQRLTAVETAANELRRRILSGTFGEGKALRQDALAEEFGISRIPLREAFRQLAAEGLLTIHPHRGVVVSSLSATEIAELFDLRAMLEPDLIRRAVPSQTEADWQKAEQILAGYAKAISDGDMNAWGELNTEYHLALYGPARRPRSLALARTLLTNTDRYTRLQLAMTDGTQRAQREHAEMLDLCRRGAAEEVAELVRWHAVQVRYDLLQLLKTDRSRQGARQSQSQHRTFKGLAKR